LEKDLAMIQKEVEENHGSLAAFDEALKLVLLFAPTSFKVDLEQLDKRSEGTLWNFDAVRLWLKDPAAPRALCILGAAGTGKSSVSAALLREV
jgi:predicted AAA+ superfamily ATPase